MKKKDKDGTVTKEYLDYVKGLEREDLERFYMGADLLYDELQQKINKAIKYIEDEIDGAKGCIYMELPEETYIECWQDVLEILKGESND